MILLVMPENTSTNGYYYPSNVLMSLISLARMTRRIIRYALLRREDRCQPHRANHTHSDCQNLILCKYIPFVRGTHEGTPVGAALQVEKYCVKARSVQGRQGTF